MDKKIKKVALLTSGGDAPGMNACIRAIVLTCLRYGIEVYGYRHGYNGLIQQEYLSLRAKNVTNIIQRGGTILHSARCTEFKSDEAAELAGKNLDILGIQALLVIGGDGSFRGAKHLSEHWQGQVIGLPGTIDNDIYGTDATIGYYTAIETALESIDKVRDTADAFERIFLVEVMGRHAGFIGLSAAIASAADQIMVPELSRAADDELENIISHIEEVKNRRGNSSYIVVITENLWAEGVTKLAEILTERTKVDCRPVILGHVQRGGSPVSQDRVLATKLGVFAVESVIEGKTGVMVCEANHELICLPLETSWEKQKELDPYLIKIQTDTFDLLNRP